MRTEKKTTWLNLCDMAEFMEAMGFMQSCTTSWTSASSLFPVCHYWAKL